MTQAVRRREAAVVSRARLLLLLLLLACGAPCRALQFDETSRDLRISLSGDFMHADGALIAAARYGAAWGARVGWAHADFDSAPHAFVGFDHVWTKGRWRAGLGAAWFDRSSRVNGTRLQFDASVAYGLTGRVFVEYRHHSHGARLGIERDRPNGGWNLLGVGLAF